MLLSVNGLPVEAAFDGDARRECLSPLLGALRAIHARKGRALCIMAAPPGAGKSTLAAYLEALSRKDGLAPVQALGMDGFHYPAAYIRAHTVLRGGREAPMASVKGAPESFDLPSLLDRLEAVKRAEGPWPVYDRRIHDVSDEPAWAAGPILLVEGNWLLLDEPGWREIPPLADLTLRIDAPEELLRPRLIARKMAGGLNQGEAERFYENSDLPNIRRFAQSALPSQMRWRAHQNGSLRNCAAPVTT